MGAEIESVNGKTSKQTITIITNLVSIDFYLKESHDME